MKLDDIKEEIYYIEVVDDDVILYTEKDEYKIKENFNSLLKKLSSNFKLAHVNCIVNTKMVSIYNYIEDYFVLKNGRKVNLLLKKYYNPLKN